MKAAINNIRRKLMNSLTSNVGERMIVRRDFSLSSNLPKRILVVRPNSRLGNQLMLTPLLQEIEALLPGCKIDLFVRGNLAPILFANYQQVDRITKLPPKPFKELKKYLNTWVSLRKYHYDLVFNVDSGSSSGRLCTKWVRGKAKYFGDRYEQMNNKDATHMAKWPVYNFRWFLSQLGIAENIQPPQPLSLKLTDFEKQNGEQLLKKMLGNDKPTIMFYTFATGEKCLSKEWWKPFFAQLRQRYGENYNLLEVLPKENVSQIDFDSLNYYSTDIREMGAVMHSGKVFITGDCGVMHLASSVGIPTIALFSGDNIRTYEPYNQGSASFLTDEVTLEELIACIDSIIPYSK
ncbi:MAG: ADP-heptose--LPS heptosyltransferase [Bacteroidetes bacterium]|nr:ADP-heptose--LPS heptosyltransferase [Bacteroidota bacterium]